MDYALYKGHEEGAGNAVVAGGSKKRERTVKAGDLVIIMERFDTFDHIYVKEGDSFQNRFGLFKHSDLIGKPYGSEVKSHTTGRFVRILSPSPELWTLSLKHRTQIVHELDQSFVIFMLGLKPGSVVFESGTGSGAMSTAIMRSISPNGHLHTVEFNETRAVKAREDFAANGLGHLVTVYHADVCQKKEERGSGTTMANLVQAITGKVDAVFLDVPDPWLPVGFAKDVLKPNARVATYSPCIEQVARTCEALKKANFHSLRTIEVRLKVYDVKKIEVETPDFGDAPPPSLAAAAAPSSSPVVAAAAEGPAAVAMEVVKDDEEEEEEEVMAEEEGGAQEEEEEENGQEAQEEDGEAAGREDEENEGHGKKNKKKNNNRGQKRDHKGKGAQGRKRKLWGGGGGGGAPVVPYAKARNQMRGHTAFLTFATAGIMAMCSQDENKGAERAAATTVKGGDAAGAVGTGNSYA